MQQPKQHRFHVALSYAQEDADFVRKVAHYLRERHVRVFFDEFEQNYLWGRDKANTTEEIFALQSQYVVMFISQHYKKSTWADREKQSALSRAIKEKREYVLPARFDDTELLGLLPTISCINLQNETPDSFGAKVLAKVAGPGIPAIGLSSRLQQDIERLHISDEIRQSIYTVLTDVEFPTRMSMSGSLIPNPIWEGIPTRTRRQLADRYRIDGPSAPQVKHLDMLLIRCNDAQSHGRIFTYFSPAWGTNLITFRPWLPQDKPDRRQEMNAKQLAKYLLVSADSILVTALPNTYAVSVKRDEEYHDLKIYIYEFSSVLFTETPVSFTCGQPKTHPGNANEGPWFYLQTLRKDSKSLSVNGDVIRTLHDSFGVSLGSLPDSFPQGFVQKGSV